MYVAENKFPCYFFEYSCFTVLLETQSVKMQRSPVIHLEIEHTDSLSHVSMSPRPTAVSPRPKNLIKISRNF